MNRTFFALFAIALLAIMGCNRPNKGAKNTETAVAEGGIYSISVKDIARNDVSLADYKGKVLLIVNVASKCGLTPQYEALENLYQKYKDRGLEILAFPCNQFRGQEPGTNEEILSFCTNDYNVSFRLFDKVEVNGEAESPLYTYLKQQAPFAGWPAGTEAFAERIESRHREDGNGFDQGNAIRWNFGKFLVSRDGNTIKRFEPPVTPAEIEAEIVAML